jgi:hypothetical protein
MAEADGVRRSLDPWLDPFRWGQARYSSVPVARFALEVPVDAPGWSDAHRAAEAVVVSQATADIHAPMVAAGFVPSLVAVDHDFEDDGSSSRVRAWHLARRAPDPLVAAGCPLVSATPARRPGEVRHGGLIRVGATTFPDALARAHESLDGAIAAAPPGILDDTASADSLFTEVFRWTDPRPDRGAPDLARLVAWASRHDALVVRFWSRVDEKEVSVDVFGPAPLVLRLWGPP